MKIIVCVKLAGRLLDEVELDSSGTGVDPAYLEWALNEWDAYAVEEALRLKERHGGTVLAVTYGDEQDEDALRRCLAMGADEAIRVADGRGDDPLSVAAALAEAIRAEEPDLVVCGAQSSDSGNAATGVMLSALLGLPRAAVVVGVDVEAGGGRAVVRRELERGLIDEVEIDLPAVLTMQTGANKPRYAPLRAIRQADSAEIAVREVEPAAGPAARVRALSTPPRVFGGELLNGSVEEIARRIVEIVRERLP